LPFRCAANRSGARRGGNERGDGPGARPPALATTSGKIAASVQPLVKHLSQPGINHALRKGDDTSN
jgi:hypothetical protein